MVCKGDGAVELYEDNSLKLKTGVTGDYGSVQLQNGKNGWYGVSCNGQTVFMSDGNDIGLYNDTDNEWILKGTRNGEVQLRYNDSIKFQTTSSGATVTGVIQTNNTPNADPYAGFHAKSSGSGNHCGFFADTINCILQNYQRTGIPNCMFFRKKYTFPISTWNIKSWHNKMITIVR